MAKTSKKTPTKRAANPTSTKRTTRTVKADAPRVSRKKAPRKPRSKD